VCTLCREFASFMPVYSDDVFDSNVQNLRWSLLSRPTYALRFEAVHFQSVR